MGERGRSPYESRGHRHHIPTTPNTGVAGSIVTQPGSVAMALTDD